MSLIAELNKNIPRFSTNGGPFRLRFPNDKRVQKPLQDIYSLFIESYLFIIAFLRKRDPRKLVLRASGLG